MSAAKQQSLGRDTKDKLSAKLAKPMSRMIDKRWHIAILASLALVLIGLNLSFLKEKELQTSFVATPSNGEFRTGEVFSIGIYLAGRDAQGVTAAEVRLTFDEDSLKLISARPGPFFRQPLVIVWDEEGASFALSLNPQVSDPAKGAPNPEFALLELEFLAVNPTAKAQVGFAPESQVYVYKRGGVYPSPFNGYYKISAAYE